MNRRATIMPDCQRSEMGSCYGHAIVSLKQIGSWLDGDSRQNRKTAGLAVGTGRTAVPQGAGPRIRAVWL